jgi:hypothetical protein
LNRDLEIPANTNIFSNIGSKDDYEGVEENKARTFEFHNNFEKDSNDAEKDLEKRYNKTAENESKVVQYNFQNLSYVNESKDEKKDYKNKNLNFQFKLEYYDGKTEVIIGQVNFFLYFQFLF